MYSKDIATWSIEAMRDKHTSRGYDLGKGIPLSVIQVAQDVNKNAGNNADMVYAKMRKGETIIFSPK